MQVLVVRKNRMGLGAEEVVIPDPQKRHQNRNVLFEGRRAEMDVGRVRAGQKLGEIVETDRKGDRKADRTGESPIDRS